MSDKWWWLYVDFSLEEEYLFGSLRITIDRLSGLKQNAGLDKLRTFYWK